MTEYYTVDRRVVDALAGYAYGEVVTCGTKNVYPRLLTAKDSAEKLSIKRGRPLEPYRCVWCDHWHIGRAMMELERLQWMNAITAAMEHAPRRAVVDQ